MDFPSLTFTDVSRHFGRRRALNQVSLPVRRRRDRRAARAERRRQVDAAVDRRDAAGAVRRRRALRRRRPRDAGAALRARIGLLGHDLYIYPELSAAENLRSSPGPTRCATSSGVVEAALERAGLAERDDPVGTFSRGMRQRLALERALLHEPRLVLLDEPFTGLDDAATTRLRARLRGSPAAGCIVLVTTHDLETIDGVADRAVVLRERAADADRRRRRVAARTLPPGQS